MQRALLIYNPAAGGWRDSDLHARRLATELGRSSLDVEIARTARPGHAEELARKAAAEQMDAVFSYGGDGTLRECAAGLLGSSTALGFLPGGTANVMARVLGLPMSPRRAAALLATGESVSLDVGMCGRRPVLMQVSAGLDAHVLARLDSRRKRVIGKAEVGLCLAPAWWSYSYPTFDVTWADNRREVTFAAVCNIPFYGGPWKMAPRARPDDQMLDLVLFRGRGRRATLGFARDLLLNRHWRRSDVEIVRTREVGFSSADGLAPQIDGDTFDDALPLTVRLASEPVRFLVPGRR